MQVANHGRKYVEGYFVGEQRPRNYNASTLLVSSIRCTFISVNFPTMVSTNALCILQLLLRLDVL